MVCCPCNDIFDFMKSYGKVAPEAITVQSAYEYIRAMTSVEIASFVNTGKTLFRAVLAPHEALIMPAGYFTIDSVRD